MTDKSKKKHWFAFDGGLEAWLDEKSQPRFRHGQVQKWIFENRAESFEAMTNLPLPLRNDLSDTFRFWTTEIVRHLKSEDGTEKLLLKLEDENLIECVLLRDGSRRTICVSSQVGCAMGCVFCASGLDGVKRNLLASEILEQMLRLQRLLPEDERLSHIVMMGMGEPLANISNVLKALDLATSEDGLGISPRRVTISTVGLPNSIDKLAEHGRPYNLAVSLHAPNDRLRDQLVPVNDKIGIAAILEAADKYFEVSGRRLTFEYVLLGEVNDSDESAQELADCLRDKNALVNVIPYNPVDGLPWKEPTAEQIERFGRILRTEGINVQFRIQKGEKINAACGQLRRNQSLVNLER